jgi:hypothetical protein
MNILYIYIFEDGEVRQSIQRPTVIDEECIDDGVLEVLTIRSDSQIEVVGFSDNEPLPQIERKKMKELSDIISFYKEYSTP